MLYMIIILFIIIIVIVSTKIILDYKKKVHSLKYELEQQGNEIINLYNRCINLNNEIEILKKLIINNKEV